ncbi:MAG: hypothetical protein ABIU84_14785 [Thermoanaerobaculia bacterium]
MGLVTAFAGSAAAQWDDTSTAPAAPTTSDEAPDGLPQIVPNLFPRGEFDDAADVAGWTSNSGVGEFTFNVGLDVDQCLDSGSSRVTADEPLAGTLYRTAICAGAITGGQSYDVGLRASFPEQDDSGDLVLRIGWYPGPNCTGLTVQTDTFPALPSSAGTHWQYDLALLSPPPTAVSYVVALTLNKTTAGSLYVEVDRIFARRHSSIFADGFQIGDGGGACRWSVPDLP